MLIKMLLLGIWMIWVPLGIGFFARELAERKNQTASENHSLFFVFGSGYILMWAIFQLAAVPFILKEQPFRYLELVFELFCLPAAIAGTALFLMNRIRPAILQWKEKKKTGKKIFPSLHAEDMVCLALWLLFLAGLLFQVIQAYRLAYADGDDAFYVAISTSTCDSGEMYLKHPYTGQMSVLDIRHGLAPFPIWISFIALKCGVNAAVAAHSLVPLILIPLTYVIYLEFGRMICGTLKDRGEKVMLPIFMIFVSLLQIFGNYSIYPASTFLLTRSRQGKAALGNVILPFLVLILFRIAEELKKQGKADRQNIFWLTAAMAAGCLCSTMSGFLCGMLIMMTAGLLLLLYRKPGILWQGFLSCIPGIFYTLIYMIKIQ